MVSLELSLEIAAAATRDDLMTHDLSHSLRFSLTAEREHSNMAGESVGKKWRESK